MGLLDRRRRPGPGHALLGGRRLRHGGRMAGRRPGFGDGLGSAVYVLRIEVFRRKGIHRPPSPLSGFCLADGIDRVRTPSKTF